MKKLAIFLFSIVFLFAFKSQAQILNNQRRIDLFVNYTNLFKTSSEYEDDYIGSPYLNKSFLLGTIYINGKIYAKNVGLRYNAVMDEIEVKKSISDDDSKISALMKTPGITVDIMGTILLYVPEKGYFEISYSGEKYSLLKKLGKIYFPPTQAKNSFEKDVPAEFKDKTTYFVVPKGSDLIELPASKGKKLKTLLKIDNNVKSLIKKHKININKEEDLIKIVKLLDTNS